jgi:hypothetical protein
MALLEEVAVSVVITNSNPLSIQINEKRENAGSMVSQAVVCVPLPVRGLSKIIEI